MWKLIFGIILAICIFFVHLPKTVDLPFLGVVAIILIAFGLDDIRYNKRRRK
jgi:hypothetical protein